MTGKTTVGLSERVVTYQMVCVFNCSSCILYLLKCETKYLGEKNKIVFSRTATDIAQASKHSSVIWINWLEVKVALHVNKAGKAVET